MVEIESDPLPHDTQEPIPYRAEVWRKAIHLLALVEGSCEGEGSWEDYLVKERRHVRVVSATYPRAKHAALHWQSLAIRDHLSLVDVRLETGRSHQVRVQFAHRGCPLLGDMRYGARHELDGRNLALHCYRLTVTHPTKQERMTWGVAPPPSWPSLFDDVLGDDLVR